MDLRELTTILDDPESATHQLLKIWRDVPLLLMLEVDWERGPLVLIGTADDVAAAATGQSATVGPNGPNHF
jgi:hypothetical protein